MIRWQKTDGDPQEHLDCTVLALSNAFKVPYADAHALLEKAGRKPRHKFAFLSFMCWHFSLFGQRVTQFRPPRGSVTLSQFLKDFPKGTFIVRRRGHVFCVRDGVVLDQYAQGPRRHIVNIWYIGQVPA